MNASDRVFCPALCNVPHTLNVCLSRSHRMPQRACVPSHRCALFDQFAKPVLPTVGASSLSGGLLRWVDLLL